MSKKPRSNSAKHHAGQRRTTACLSFSLPLELEEPLNTLAAEAGMSRSEYLTNLVRLEHLASKGEKLWPQAPLRIRRKPA